MKEIVTLQLGCFANFIGSHFWNFQDELLGLAEDAEGDPTYRMPSFNMDILYRSGETQQGHLTYTPRLISIGFQGSLGSLSPYDTSYNAISQSEPSEITTWAGDISRHVAEPHTKNLFLQRISEEQTLPQTSGSHTVDENPVMEDELVIENLENEVEFWTDFSKVHYHRRTLCELHGSWSTLPEFDCYGIGRQLFSCSAEAEQVCDQLRFFAEECDHMQGIQCMVDDSGGFCGVAAELLEHVADEYPNKPVLLFSARGTQQKPSSSSNLVRRALHDAISFSVLAGLSSLIVPIGLPSLSSSKACHLLHVNDSKSFHTSAVYAASIHSIGLPLRMYTPGPTSNSSHVTGAVDLGQLVHILADQTLRNKVSILDVAMPAPALQGSLLKSLHPLTPNTTTNVDWSRTAESLVVHGAFTSGNQRASISEAEKSICREYEDGRSMLPHSVHLALALCPLPIPLPFPSIFGSPVDVSSVPMAARLRSSPAILPFIRWRSDDLRRLGLARGAAGARLLAEWGLAGDEAADLAESLSSMIAELDPHLDPSSESD